MTIRRATYDPTREDGGPDGVLLDALLRAEAGDDVPTSPRQQAERTTRDRVAYVQDSPPRCVVMAVRDWEQTCEIELWLPFEVGAGPDLLKLLAECCRAMVLERPLTVNYEVWGWLRPEVAERWRTTLVDRRRRSVVTNSPPTSDGKVRSSAPMSALLEFFTRVGV